MNKTPSQIDKVRNSEVFVVWFFETVVHYYVDLGVICDPGQRHVLCLV